MPTKTITVQDYLAQLPDDRREAMNKLRQTILNNLPKGFAEIVGSVGISYSVPHTLYPGGYHCDPKQPLPFITIASQKNFIAVYHMGVYANKKLLEWFIAEYPKHCKTKLDMGKSCIRFKKIDQIPFELIAELSKKLTAQEWIKMYESIIKR